MTTCFHPLPFHLGVALILGPSAVDADTFTNPIDDGQDPHVIRHRGKYVWTESARGGVGIRITDGLTDRGEREIVWRAPEEGPVSRQLWAPEAHFLGGRWHVYFAASDGDNANHLAYVIRSRTENPYSNYTLFGPFATGEGEDGRSPNIWAIDMTVMEHDGEHYAIWSGWDAPGTDMQFLYIAPMASPTELAGPRVRICDHDDHLWERTEERRGSRGLNEGPQVLKHEDRTFVTYSCGASWLPTYKLGLLELTGDDPLDPESWEKHPEPVFESTDETFGVGHGSFVKSPDGSEWWHVYHAKDERESGWDRSIFAQPFSFDESGFPDFGTPVDRGEPLPVPSGEPTD